VDPIPDSRNRFLSSPQRPDQLWCLHSLLSNRHGVLSPTCYVNHSAASTAEAIRVHEQRYLNLFNHYLKRVVMARVYTVFPSPRRSRLPPRSLKLYEEYLNI
jgi:hypothetical protein